MSIDLEYAIKKDIRNNPVVRELDARAEARVPRGSSLLAGLSWSACCSSRLAALRDVRYGYSIEELRDELASEETVNRQLRPELETLRASAADRERAPARTRPRRADRRRHGRHRTRTLVRSAAGVVAARSLRPNERVHVEARGSPRASSAAVRSRPVALAEDRPDAGVRSALGGGRSSAASLVVLACLAVLGGRHRGAAGVICRSFQHDELVAKARQQQQQTCSARGRCAATSSIATARCWPTRSSASRSSPTRSMVKDAGKDVPRTSAPRSATAPPKERQELRDKLSPAQYALIATIRRSRAVSPEQVSRVARARSCRHRDCSSDSRRYYPRYDLGGACARIRRSRQQGPGRRRVHLRQARPRRRRAALRAGGRQTAAARDRASSGRRSAGATLELTIDLQPAVHRRARAQGGRRGASARRRHGHHHGSADRRDSRAGELSDVQSQRRRRVRTTTTAATARRRTSTSQDRRSRSSRRRRRSRKASSRRRISSTPVPAHHVPGAQAIDERTAQLRRDVVRGRIVKSSNVGAIKIGLRTGAERSARYVHRFGFGAGACTGLRRAEPRHSGTRRIVMKAGWRRCRWATRSA